MTGDVASSESASTEAPENQGAAGSQSSSNQVLVETEVESLSLKDVLRSDASDDVGLGAFLSFETIGDDTVVSIEASGTGPTLSFPVATLEGLTGVTLQDLLASNLISG